MGFSVLRKLEFGGRIASALAVPALAFAALGAGSLHPAAAQLFSEGYEFLEAVKERDGDVATEMLSVPGTQIVNTRDLTSGETGLHIVAQRRDTLWIRFLLARGGNPNIRDKNGITPLQISTRLGHVDGAEALVKGGASVNVADSQGETPLISAVHQRDVAMVRYLLEAGADPDRTDNSGRSARDYLELMTGATLLVREFEEADAKREGQPKTENYGPSF